MKENRRISYISPYLLAGLDKNAPVLLAFSGGADSCALLRLLISDSHKNGYQLSVAHFNHKIRKDAAERDALFCKRTAEEYSLPFYLGEADVPALAKKSGNSLETEAREQRYAFFERIMRENNIPILVTAHHADDQIESVILHLLRGSGITGLRGMSECRTFCNDLYLVRPLLNTEKSDILDCCEAESIPYVTDETNGDTAYVRNAIRANITPQMRALQPNLASVFLRLSENAAQTDDFMTDIALRFIKNECADSIPLESLNSVHPALRAKVVSLFFETAFHASLESIHVKNVLALCQRAIPHSSVSLPLKTAAKIDNNALYFLPDAEKEAFTPYRAELREGIYPLCNGISVSVERTYAPHRPRDPFTLDIRRDILKNGAHFRPKKEGDTVFSGKMNKKVKKLFNEKGIPLSLRKKLPLLVSNDEILWIPSVAVCDKIKEDIINEGGDFLRITVIIEK